MINLIRLNSLEQPQKCGEEKISFLGRNVLIKEESRAHTARIWKVWICRKSGKKGEKSGAGTSEKGKKQKGQKRGKFSNFQNSRLFCFSTFCFLFIFRRNGFLVFLFFFVFFFFPISGGFHITKGCRNTQKRLLQIE